MKEKGNLLFSQKKYTEAIESYSAAIELQPRNAVFLSNRAICYLKLERFDDAEIDCTRALSADPRNTKAYFRRGTARVGLGKLEEAKFDFESVLDLEPNNGMAKQELERISETCRISKTVEKICEQNAIGQIPEWFPMPKDRALDFGVISVKKWEGGEDEKMKTVPLRETANLHHVIGSRVPSPPKVKQEHKEAPLFVYAPPPESWFSLPDPPTTAYQFQNDIRTLRKDKENLCKYLKGVDSSKLPQFFGLNLESSILQDIIDCFPEGDVDDANARQFFTNLKRVDRYLTVALFLDQQYKLKLSKFTEE